MEKQMINQILENFVELTGIKAKWRPIKEADFMYDYSIEGYYYLWEQNTEVPLIHSLFVYPIKARFGNFSDPSESCIDIMGKKNCLIDG